MHAVSIRAHENRENNFPVCSPTPSPSPARTPQTKSLFLRVVEFIDNDLLEMGVIEDGSISGVLPSSSDAFAVHYPGYPSSTERAIQTLGGMQQILKVSLLN